MTRLAVSRLDLGHRHRHHADAPGLGRRLAHDHLARGNEAIGQEIHDVVLAASALAAKLLPVELVPDDEIAAPAPLEVALLKAGVARHHGRRVLEARAEQKAVVVRGRGDGLVGGAPHLGCGSRWWWQRHDVCGVGRVVAGGEGVEGRGGGEEEVRAEAVVGVDCRGGGEGEFLRGRGRGHRKVVAGGLGDVHGGEGGLLREPGVEGC